MTSPSFDRAVRRATQQTAAAFGRDIGRLREDAGITRSQLAREAGLDRSYVRRIEVGEVEPSIEACVRLVLALGADPALRAYPNTGPAIRDRHQASIGETFLRTAHVRWRRFSELAVRSPSRGWIDYGLHDPAASIFVATEIESTVRRLEQQIRWGLEKATSLPSWEHWTRLVPSPTVSSLLILRDTRVNREVASEFRRQLQVAFPADPRDALEALAGTARWPGSAVLWAVREAAAVVPAYRIVARP